MVTGTSIRPHRPESEKSHRHDRRNHSPWQSITGRGIREKILAAKRAGIKEIILCCENKKDIDDIKKEYLKGLKFHYVDHIKEVLETALLKA